MDQYQSILHMPPCHASCRRPATRIGSTAAHQLIGAQRRGPTLRHIPLWRVRVLHFFP
jgi:hypothetical protein